MIAQENKTLVVSLVRIAATSNLPRGRASDLNVIVNGGNSPRQSIRDKQENQHDGQIPRLCRLVSMAEPEILQKLRESVVQADIDAVESAAKEALSAGIDPLRAIDEGLSKGLREIGEKFARQEVFLTDMMLSAEATQRGVKILKTAISGHKKLKNEGTVVIGTVRGDIHDIGKNIVATLLMANGYDIHDLGTDVPAEKFISKAKETNAAVIGLSALLSTAMPEQESVVKGLNEIGERQKFKVIVGGAPVTEEWAKNIGADAYGGEAADAVAKVNELVRQH